MTICMKCGKDFPGETPGTRHTTMNIRNGRTVLSSTVSEVCPECTVTRACGVRIEKVEAAQDDVVDVTGDK